MIDQQGLLEQINQYDVINVGDIIADNEVYTLHNIEVSVVRNDDEATLQAVADLLQNAGGGLLPRTIEQLRSYTESGAMFVVRAIVDGEPEPRVIFTFSVEPGHSTNVELIGETFPIFERGAMAIAPDIKHHGLALPMLNKIYQAIPDLSKLFLLVTSINPSVWYNNLSMGMVPVAIDEHDPLVQDLITWTCVCGNHITGDMPPGQTNENSTTHDPQVHPCFKRLSIGDNIVYPVNKQGRFVMGSDIIFITRQMYDMFRGLGARVEDVSLKLYDALASDPRLANEADPNNAYRFARLAELWNALTERLNIGEC